MTFQSGDMAKGLVTTLVSEANENAAIDAKVNEASKKNQTLLSAAIDQRAKETALPAGMVRFASSFPQINFIMPDGVKLTFRGGFLDTKEHAEIEELRKAIKAGNKQFWEPKKS